MMMCCIKKCRWIVLMTFVCAWLFITRTDISAQILHISPAQGVWDATGNYPNNEFDATNNIDLVQDDKGKITGFGTGSGSDSGIDVNLFYNFSGSIKGGSNDARVLLTMRVSGSATDGVTTLPVSGNIKLSLDLDKALNILLGSGKGKICVQRQCARVDEPVQLDLPQPMDGSWALDLDLLHVDGRVSGTATATLSNGRTLSFVATGHSRTIRRQARVSLQGPAGTIMLVSDPHSLGLLFAKAKLLGQSVGPRTTLFP